MDKFFCLVVLVAMNIFNCSLGVPARGCLIEVGYSIEVRHRLVYFLAVLRNIALS